MAELKDFKLPDVGEGLTEADILRWDVKVGDAVVVNQVLVEVETAKAAVELPSPYAGIVHAIHVEEGTTVPVGQPIVTLKVGAGDVVSAGPDASAGTAREDLVPSIEVVAEVAPAKEERQAVLVGYGVSGERGRRRKRSQPSHDLPAPSANPAFEVTPGTGATTPPTDRSVLAKPPVRKLAKSLGVALSDVIATGPNGSISRDDVQAAASSASLARASSTAPVRADSPEWEERIPIRGVRKHTAAAMVSSAFTAPHVTEFITVDVTAMMELRERVAARREFRGVKVSPLLFVARAVLWAIKRTPIINSTWDQSDGESGSIIIKRYVNLGIAAATDRGLIVPNIKGAQDLSLAALANSLTDLTELARSGKTPPSDMSGGTFTITNVGVFGVDTGTPILNPGEAAILAFGAIRRQPWVVGTGADERIEPRWITQLAVSFDHRSVDGQQGSEFLADVAAVLRDPGLALL